MSGLDQHGQMQMGDFAYKVQIHTGNCNSSVFVWQMYNSVSFSDGFDKSAVRQVALHVTTLFRQLI